MRASSLDLRIMYGRWCRSSLFSVCPNTTRSYFPLRNACSIALRPTCVSTEYPAFFIQSLCAARTFASLSPYSTRHLVFPISDLFRQGLNRALKYVRSEGIWNVYFDQVTEGPPRHSPE